MMNSQVENKRLIDTCYGQLPLILGEKAARKQVSISIASIDEPNKNIT